MQHVIVMPQSGRQVYNGVHAWPPLISTKSFFNVIYAYAGLKMIMHSNVNIKSNL